MRLIGANKPRQIEPLEPTGGVSHYYLGNDPSRWRTNVPHYKSVRYRDVYPGVDQLFYSNAGRMEFDLSVAPGASPERIEIAFDGARSAKLDALGDLVLTTESGDVRMRRPTVYQTEANGRRTQIDAGFRLTGRSSAAFLLAGYDSHRALVIDPSVEYSTYLGGSGYDQGNSIALDSSGNTYIAGSTTSTNFPNNDPLGYGKYEGDTDAFVSKLSPAGTAIVYSTYFGGSSFDRANAIAVDSSGNAYITGLTQSNTFPVSNPFQRTLLSTAGNAFVVKLTSTGMLGYATYLGGTGFNGDAGRAIAADGSGNAYVAGRTSSLNFPTMNPIALPKDADSQNAFVSKISPDGSVLIYSTLLGGNADDAAEGIAIDAAGDAYVTGTTYSTDFPVMQSISPSSPYLGDAFVTKINPAGSALVYSTLIGPATAAALAVDSSGNTYIVGTAGSAEFPTKNAKYPVPLYDTYLTSFVSKIDAAGSSLVFSTFFLGCTLSAVAVDAAGRAYVAGSTTDRTKFPLVSAIQPNMIGDQDGVLAAFSADGSSLLYSTLLGSGQALGIASDANGDIYVTGYGSSLPFDGAAYQPKPKGTNAFIFAYSAIAGPLATTVNAASYAVSVAPNSIASVFGADIASQTGGTTVHVTDANGTTLAAELFFVSPTQVNLLIPQTLSTGPGQVQVVSGDETISVGPLQIAAVAPGLFGTYAPPGAEQFAIAQTGDYQIVLQLNSVTNQYEPIPINLAAAPNATYLIMYGTGIRNATLDQITVLIGGQIVSPSYAGIQCCFAGLDQVNLLIPASLVGAGDVPITLTAAGVTSNTVHVVIQ